MRRKRLTGFGILAVGFAVAPVRAQLTNNLASNLQVYYSFNNPAANGGFAPDYISPALTAQTGTSASGYVANQYDYLSLPDSSTGTDSTPDWTGGPQSVNVNTIPTPSSGNFQGPYASTTNVVQFSRDTNFPPSGSGPGGAGNFLNVPSSVYQNGPATINGSLTYSVWYNFQTYGYSNGGDYSGDRQFVLESTQNSSFFSSGTTANTTQFTALSYGLKTSSTATDWTGAAYAPNNNLGSTTYGNLYTDTATTGSGTQINFNLNAYNSSQPAVTGGESNQWVNLVAVYNNGSNNGTEAPGTQPQNATTGVGYLVGYIDGVYAGEVANTSYATSPNLVSVGGLQIGEYRGGSTSGSARNFNGYIAELAVWNTALNQSEINSIQTTPVSAAVAAASNLAFTGSAGNGIWDTSTANWNGGSGATTYSDGHDVTFDDNDNPGQQNIIVNSTVSPGMISISTNGNYTFTGTGVIGGDGGLVVNGSGTVTISNTGPNTYGSTFVAGGTVNFNSSGAMPTGQNLTINQGATVNFASLGTAQTIVVDQLAVGGNLNLNNNNLVISSGAIYGGTTGAASGTITSIGGSGQITGTGGITATGSMTFVLGSGTLTLANTGTNNWGSTNVASGTLFLPSVTEIPVNQSLIIGSGADVTYTNSGPGSTIVLPLLSVSGTLNLNNNNLQVSGGSITGSGALGDIIGTGSIVASGNPGLIFNAGSAGTITLGNTGVNTYGSTTVAAGTLNISSGSALPVDQNMNIASGAKLVLGNNGSPYSVQANQFSIAGTLNLSNNSIVITSGTVVSTGTAGSIIGTGSVQNSGGLVFSPGTSGIFKIADTGPNTWGSTNVTSGTLTLGSVGALPVGQNLTIATGATISASNLGSGNTQFLQVNQLTDNGIMNISNNSLTIQNGTVGTTGSIVGLNTSTLTVTGPGTLTLSDASNNSFGSTTVSGGQLVLASAGALPVGQNLNIAGGASVVATKLSSPHLLQVNQLIDSGVLDLNNNDLLVHSGTLSAVTSLVQSGYNNGNWNGTTGVISSAAASDSAHLTALGVILNDNGSGTPLYGAGGTLASKFEGATPVDGDILVKLTYYGDTNLDGKVDGTDYSRIDNGYLNHLSGWSNGDFNYDGVVDGSDYTLIDNAFNTQGAQISSEIAAVTAEIAPALAVSAVPEPATLGLLGIGALALLGRRRLR